jgi:hypothetical protein
MGITANSVLWRQMSYNFGDLSKLYRGTAKVDSNFGAII